MAAPTICEPNSSWINEWTVHKSTNLITHARGYVLPRGATGTVTKTAEFQTQISAAISYTSTATISATLLKTGLEAQVGYTIAANLSKTSIATTSVTTNVTLAGTYVFFEGRRFATGQFNGGRCNGSGTVIFPVKGRMQSYAIPYDGAVWCGESPAAGTMKAQAKIYCD